MKNRSRVILLAMLLMMVMSLSFSAMATSPDIGTIMSTSFTTAVADAITGIVAIIPLGLQIFAIMFVVKAGMKMFKTTATAGG